MCNTHKLRIKEVRLARGLSQADLASLVGIKPGFLSEIEHHTKNPSFKTLCSIADVLEVCLKDLILCNCKCRE